MIDLYYWTTPNGHKITIFLEEVALPYTIKPVNISNGEQLAAEFLAISLFGQGRRAETGGLTAWQLDVRRVQVGRTNTYT